MKVKQQSIGEMPDHQTNFESQSHLFWSHILLGKHLFQIKIQAERWHPQIKMIIVCNSNISRKIILLKLKVKLRKLQIQVVGMMLLDKASRLNNLVLQPLSNLLKEMYRIFIINVLLMSNKQIIRNISWKGLQVQPV